MLRDMSAYKKIFMLGVIGLVFVGIFDALSNLPVVSGCTYYGNCLDGSAEPQTEPGLDPSEQ